MAGESGGQDWLALLYLLAAGLISVAVESIRRIAQNRDEEQDYRRKEAAFRRRMELEEKYHRRWDDLPEGDRDDEGDKR